MLIEPWNALMAINVVLLEMTIEVETKAYHLLLDGLQAIMDQRFQRFDVGVGTQTANLTCPVRVK